MGRSRRKQAGLTIVETLIVVAIIGIIASVVMPSVRSYTARAKVSEALNIMQNCRLTISEMYQFASSMPGIGNWGCELENPSRLVERITTTEDGTVVVTLGGAVADLRLAFHDITLTPLSPAMQPMGEYDLGTPVRRWRCGNPDDGTDLAPEFLPGSCRGI